MLWHFSVSHYRHFDHCGHVPMGKERTWEPLWLSVGPLIKDPEAVFLVMFDASMNDL
jgi:hypothetical protein